MKNKVLMTGLKKLVKYGLPILAIYGIYKVIKKKADEFGNFMPNKEDFLPPALRTKTSEKEKFTPKIVKHIEGPVAGPAPQYENIDVGYGTYGLKDFVIYNKVKYRPEFKNDFDDLKAIISERLDQAKEANKVLKYRLYYDARKEGRSPASLQILTQMLENLSNTSYEEIPDFPND